MQSIRQDWLPGVRELFLRETENRFLFVPVFLGAGSASYFSLSREPSSWFLASLLALAILFLVVLRKSWLHACLAGAFFLFAAGMVVAAVRTVAVSAPVLQRALKGVKVEAVIRTVETRPGKKWRLTLRPLFIQRLPAKGLPHYIRLTTRSKGAGRLYPGQVVRFRASLFRPSRPPVPHGYDFARRAFFQKIGAVGYSLSRMTVIGRAHAGQGWSIGLLQFVEHLRQDIGRRITVVLPGEEGAVATALLTGKRGGIDRGLYDDIRHSGLAHLLAISGLHMAVMAGTLFWTVHMLLALVPGLALRYPVRKWAVLVSLGGATFYLLLSGAGIATQRAYIMLVIGFLAILLDRPALTLRNLALAATLVLLLFPESVWDAGFQMSFAATAALISFYEYHQARTRERAVMTGGYRPFQFATRFLYGVFLTSLVAGIAVIPFTAFHFHQIAVYSLAGNLLVMPIFVFVVMPMTLLTLVLMPLGLEFVSLEIMATGLSYIIVFSQMVASWPGAVYTLPVFPLAWLVVMTLGGLWLTLLKTGLRFLGLVPVIIALYFAFSHKEYDILVDEKREAVAVLDKNTYRVMRLKKKKSALERWLKFSNRPYARIGKAKEKIPSIMGCDPMACIISVRGQQVALVRNRSALYEECQKSGILVLDFPLRKKHRTCPLPDRVITSSDMKKNGALAIRLDGIKASLVTVTGVTGQRPWSYRPYRWRP